MKAKIFTNHYPIQALPFLLLENESVSNEIKNVEQTFSNQLNFLKLEFEKKLSDMEFKQKKCFHPRNNSSPDLKTLISKHDALNTRMRKQ